MRGTRMQHCVRPSTCYDVELQLGDAGSNRQVQRLLADLRCLRPVVSRAPRPARRGGSPPQGGGVATSDCQSACTEIIATCNFAPVGQMNACVSACVQYGYQYQIDCVNNNTCGDIQRAAGSAPTTARQTRGTAHPTSPSAPTTVRCCTLTGCLTADEPRATANARERDERCGDVLRGDARKQACGCSSGYPCYTTFTQ